MHGSPSTVYPTINTPGGLVYERPMSPRLLAEYITGQNLRVATGGNSIKLAICYGANSGWFTKSAGQTLATALGRDVWAAKGVTYSPTGSPNANWVRFQP
jgi:hypothetical protein